MDARALLSRGVSRRRFLAGAAMGVGGIGLGLGAGDEALRIGRGALHIEQAWSAASLSNSDFLAAHGSVFDKVALGCSFAPEQWRRPERESGQALGALKFAVEDLGLREVRLGIRWDQAAREDGSVALRLYDPYLDYCFQRGVNVALNVGPIRTFRWPEDHVPGFALSRIEAPPIGARIQAGSGLASLSFVYLDTLLDALLAGYGEKIRELTAIQLENEPFFSFGRHEWTMSEGYLKQVFHQVAEKISTVPLLLTSAGRLDLRSITNFFHGLIAEDNRFRGRLISGFDYHYKTARLAPYPLVRYLDPIVLALKFPPAKTCDANIRDARAADFRIEVSEGEAEPTGAINSPGNSARDFRFMLLRCAENVLDAGKRSPLRIWGIEYLARKALSGEATAEHRQIFDLVQRLTEARDAPENGA